MKKLLLLAVLAFGMNVSAQDKASVGVFRGNENSYGIEITGQYNSLILGVGGAHLLNSSDNNNLGIFVLAGYQWKELRLVSRTGAASYTPEGKTFTYGGYAGVQVTKNLAINFGYDTANKYTTGLTFNLN